MASLCNGCNLQNPGHVSTGPTFEQLIPLARAAAKMAIRRDAPGGDILMEVVLDNMPIMVKARPDVYELIVCDMVIAESSVLKGKSLSWYLDGYENDPDRDSRGQ
ncbi:MAG: hypothetical protein FWC71_02055 [Defluviitaleaceae bacterium]|nr:hypothetical protein [Defluviitaleaceae bacterium]